MDTKNYCQTSLKLKNQVAYPSYKDFPKIAIQAMVNASS